MHFNNRDIYNEISRTYSHFRRNVIATVNFSPCYNLISLAK